MKCLAHITDNPDGHDWVLVPDPQPFYTVMESNKLLWACPCSEFKWTSYAEWEKGRENSKDNIVPDSSPDTRGTRGLPVKPQSKSELRPWTKTRAQAQREQL